MIARKSKIQISKRKAFYRGINPKIRAKRREMVYAKAYLINKNLFSYFTRCMIRIFRSGSPQHRTYKTARNYRTTRNSLKLYQNGSPMYLKDITPSNVKAYETWLKGRVSKNTRGSYLRVVRAVWNKAIDEELIEGSKRPFRRVYTGIAKTKKRAVSQNIISMLKNFDLQKVPRGKYLEFSRDLFLFSFYTRGMSFIDMALLKKSDIINGEIEYIRSKTDQELSVEMEQKIIDIIKKWEPQTGPVFALPIFTGSEWNVKLYDRVFRTYWNHLNKLSELMGISPSLTSHMARHSWATLAKRKGISTSIISEALGHSSEKVTQIYLDSLENNVINEVNKIVIRLNRK